MCQLCSKSVITGYMATCYQHNSIHRHITGHLILINRLGIICRCFLNSRCFPFTSGRTRRFNARVDAFCGSCGRTEIQKSSSTQQVIWYSFGFVSYRKEIFLFRVYVGPCLN